MNNIVLPGLILSSILRTLTILVATRPWIENASVRTVATKNHNNVSIPDYPETSVNYYYNNADLLQSPSVVNQCQFVSISRLCIFSSRCAPATVPKEFVTVLSALNFSSTRPNSRQIRFFSSVSTVNISYAPILPLRWRK